MNAASAVPTPLPAKPDLEVVTRRAWPGDPWPWAPDALVDILAALPGDLHLAVAARGKPRNIVGCLACHRPLLLAYNTGRVYLQPLDHDTAGRTHTVWCPGCGTRRVFTER